MRNIFDPSDNLVISGTTRPPAGRHAAFLSGVVALLILAVSYPSLAVQPKRVVADSVEEFAEGDLESLRLLSPGSLQRGPALDLVYDFENIILWDAVRLPQTGDLFIGTGPKGEVFRLNSSGQARKITAFTESDVYALALGPDGALYAASSPDGKVFRRSPRGGDFEVWFEHGEKYVWDLAFDSKGRLLVATGESGKLFQVSGKNQGEVIFDAEQPHLRCLEMNARDGFYVGTTGSGLVYWIRDDMKPVVVLDSGRSDISALAVAPDGQLYAAAVGKKQASGNNDAKSSSSDSSKITGIKGLVTLSVSATPDTDTPSPVKPASGNSGQKGKSVSSEIYRIDHRHYPTVLEASPHEIHSLAWSNDRVLAGTGDEGVLLEIYPDGRSGPLGEVESKQITAMLPDGKDGWFLLASNWGRVFHMGTRPVERGRYLSKVIDSGLFAEWGRFKVHGDARYSIRTRSGNTPQPGNSWFEWSFLDGGRTVSPAARYFQYEILLEEGSLQRVDFTYLPENQPPHVKEVKALEPDLGFVSLQQPPQPQKIQTGGQLLKAEADPPQMIERYRPVVEPGIRTIAWEAEDPNGDELTYRLEVQREGMPWEVLADEVTDTLFSWDTSGWPDGIYYARVVASDAKSNANGNGLEHATMSAAWRIDHTPPEITLVNRSREGVRFDVRDRQGVLESVAISTNGRDYRMSVPEDSILDSGAESFFVERDPEKPLYIRARDENGNVAGKHLPQENSQ